MALVLTSCVNLHEVLNPLADFCTNVIIALPRQVAGREEENTDGENTFPHKWHRVGHNSECGYCFPVPSAKGVLSGKEQRHAVEAGEGDSPDQPQGCCQPRKP